MIRGERQAVCWYLADLFHRGSLHQVHEGLPDPAGEVEDPKGAVVHDHEEEATEAHEQLCGGHLLQFLQFLLHIGGCKD